MHNACNNPSTMNRAIQVRDVPESVHRRLKARAAVQGRSLSDLLREELKQIAERPTGAEVLKRIAAREPADPGESSAVAIRAERQG